MVGYSVLSSACSEPQRNLTAGEKDIDLGLFHRRSIRHGLVYSNLWNSADATSPRYFLLVREPAPLVSSFFQNKAEGLGDASVLNLFSLASGGALFIRDPHRSVSRDQLNGGRLVDSTPKDWELILPYLEENEKLFGISNERDLLTVDGKILDPSQVYRKVEPTSLQELA